MSSTTIVHPGPEDYGLDAVARHNAQAPIEDYSTYDDTKGLGIHIVSLRLFHDWLILPLTSSSMDSIRQTTVTTARTARRRQPRTITYRHHQHRVRTQPAKGSVPGVVALREGHRTRPTVPRSLEFPNHLRLAPRRRRKARLTSPRLRNWRNLSRN